MADRHLGSHFTDPIPQRPMRITHHEFMVYRLPYHRAVEWFRSTETQAHFVCLRLIAEDGIEGVAEASIKETWTALGVNDVIDVVEQQLLPRLDAVDIGSIGCVAQAIDAVACSSLAKMLVVNACATMAAARSGVPPWIGEGGGSVPVSWCLTRQTPRAMAEEAARMVDAHGFRAMKVKGGQGLATDRDVLAGVRAAVGDRVVLTVDANEAYDVSQVPAYLEMLAEAGVVLAEDPWPLQPDDTFGRIVESSPMPILVDMACESHEAALKFIQAGATAISVKPGRIGLHEAGRIAKFVQSAGASVCSGMYAESDLGALISLWFSASLKAPLAPAEQTFHLMMRQNVLSDPFPITNGAAHLPPTADIAKLVDWSRLRNFA